MAGWGDDASARASERMEASLQEFKEAFDALMSPTGEAPAEGRMAELERLWHKLRKDTDWAISDYVTEMLANANAEANGTRASGSPGISESASEAEY